MKAAHSDHDPFNTRRPEVHNLTGWRRLVFYPPAWSLQLYFRSFRFRLDPQSEQLLRDVPPPRLIVVWHNRSLVAPEMFRRFFDPARIACLISPSRTAAWEVAFFKQFRLRAIRGSTTRRSIQAAREMFRLLRGGNDIGISPDGPSGPLYSFQPGAVALARKAGVPLLFAIPNCPSAWRLRTWDRHLVPPPFAPIDLGLRALLPGDPAWNEPNAAVAAKARQVCLEITRDPFQIDADGQEGTH